MVSSLAEWMPDAPPLGPLIVRCAVKTRALEPKYRLTWGNRERKWGFVRIQKRCHQIQKWPSICHHPILFEVFARKQEILGFAGTTIGYICGILLLLEGSVQYYPTLVEYMLKKTADYIGSKTPTGRGLESWRTTSLTIS